MEVLQCVFPFCSGDRVCSQTPWTGAQYPYTPQHTPEPRHLTILPHIPEHIPWKYSEIMLLSIVNTYTHSAFTNVHCPCKNKQNKQTNRSSHPPGDRPELQVISQSSRWSARASGHQPELPVCPHTCWYWTLVGTFSTRSSSHATSITSGLVPLIHTHSERQSLHIPFCSHPFFCSSSCFKVFVLFYFTKDYINCWHYQPNRFIAAKDHQSLLAQRNVARLLYASPFIRPPVFPRLRWDFFSFSFSNYVSICLLRVHCSSWENANFPTWDVCIELRFYRIVR